MNIVVNKLSQLLNDRNITAYKLAKDLNMNTGVATDWLKGRASPSRKTLLKLCEYFEVPLSYFYQDESGQLLSELQKVCGQLSPEEQEKAMQMLCNQFPKLKNN